ncbi:hypothetical protein KKF34_09470 [Myxococcota bacterium]|nr:hypothetical protein [Myxococcota bacterium]MBU1497092.1 hypothetical protein [Myxococcota bacterium]
MQKKNKLNKDILIILGTALFFLCSWPVSTSFKNLTPFNGLAFILIFWGFLILLSFIMENKAGKK